MAAALNQHGRFNDRAAALAGAALAHAALLAPLALGALGLEFARVEDSEAPALLIQLEPPPNRRAVPRPSNPPTPDDAGPAPLGRVSSDLRQHRPPLRLDRAVEALTPPPGAPLVDSRWNVRSPPQARPGPVLNCRAASNNEVDQQRCAERLAARANTSLVGSGDPVRHARFAAEGAAAMASYEARRAPVGEPDEPKCTDMGPIVDCGVSINVKLFSSRDGVLPGLRRR